MADYELTLLILWIVQVQLLIGFGADVRSTAQNGFSVLHWVAAHGRKKCARSLADHAHFVEGVVKVSDTGFTPQMIAWHRNHKEVVNQNYLFN